MAVAIAVERVVVRVRVDVTVGQEVHLPDILLEVPLCEPVFVAVAHTVPVGVVSIRIRGS